MAKTERLSWIVCGRQIGSASGWDQADTFVIQLYDFEPGEGYVGPSGDCVAIDFENVTIETFDNAGERVISVDLIDAIAGCRRAGRPR